MHMRGSRSASSGVDVAIIVPAFNEQRYVAQCIDSVLAQTFEDFELIVVDDGSSDCTLEIARSFTDPRVRVLTGANEGRASARNRGIAVSRPSRYVAFLDADDLWDPVKLERQLAYLDGPRELLAVGCYMRYISSRGKIMGCTGQQVSDDDLQRIAIARHSPFAVSSCIVLRREVLATVGVFDPQLREAEDLDFLARLVRVGAVDCVPEALGCYRIHPLSAMSMRRRTVNQYRRFVQQRILARDAGRDLAWSEFIENYRPGWRERHEDFFETCYRCTAVWHGEGRPLRALGYAILSTLAAPHFAAKRFYRQALRQRLPG